MFQTLLCRLGVGHHWLAEMDKNGGYRRRCVKCGKYDRRSASWSGHLAQNDHPGSRSGPVPD